MSKIIPNNRYFQVFRKIPEFELNSGVTVTFISEVDLTVIENIRKKFGKSKPSYTAFVIKALSKALQEFPYANRRISRRIWVPFFKPRLQQFELLDIAVAAEMEIPGVESGAHVDVLRSVDKRNLTEITQWLVALSKTNTKENRQWRDFDRVIRYCPNWFALFLIRIPFLVPNLWERYRGAAAMVSSPAKYGVDTVVACWSWPIGISFGLVKDRAVVRNGQVEVRKTFNLTLNFDRRIMAGAQAGRFFAKIVEVLEKYPENFGVENEYK